MAVKDRLQELQTKARKTSKKDVDVEAGSESFTVSFSRQEECISETHMPLLRDGSTGGKFSKYQQTEKTIKEALWQAKDEIEELKHLHDRILSSLSNDAQSKAKTDKLTKQITASLTSVGKKIKEFHEAALESYKSKKFSDTEHRMLCVVNTSLINDYRKLTEELWEVRNYYEERCKRRIQRQLEIAGYPVDEKETEDALINGTPIFLREFAECEAAKLALRDLEDRHEELIKIEKSLVEVRDLFQEFALLVSTQGDLIDNIERNVTNAQCSVEAGNTQLVEGKRLRSSACRKKLICIAIAVTILVIVIIIVMWQIIKAFQ